jgi:2-polyprenyl-3-methyl-5-hydroxy-6-metoxy-1,4-benzoquinol methylase
MMKPNGSLAVQGAGAVKCSSINNSIYQAIELGAEWMFLMDVDQLFPVNTIPKLMDTAIKHNAKIVSVLYHTNTPPFSPVAGWKEKKADRTTCINSKGDIWRMAYSPLGEGVVEVDWVGSGGVLIHKDVIKDIGWAPFVDVWENGKGIRTVGHDMNFCARAKEKGYKVLVDTSVKSSHGAFTYFDDDYIQAYHNSKMVDHIMRAEKDGSFEPGYWDTVWNTEAMKGASRISSYQESADMVKDIVSHETTVSDIGCGLGDMLDYLREKNKCVCAGYDFSEQAIDQVKAKGHKGIQMDFRNPGPVGINQTDFVISMHTIEHMKDDKKFVSLMKTCCKQNGKIIIVTPWREEIQGHFEHVRGYDYDELKELGEKFFKEVKVLKNNRDWVLVATNS